MNNIYGILLIYTFTRVFRFDSEVVKKSCEDYHIMGTF